MPGLLAQTNGTSRSQIAQEHLNCLPSSPSNFGTVTTAPRAKLGPGDPQAFISQHPALLGSLVGAVPKARSPCEHLELHPRHPPGHFLGLAQRGGDDKSGTLPLLRSQPAGFDIALQGQPKERWCDSSKKNQRLGKHELLGVI